MSGQTRPEGLGNSAYKKTDGDDGADMCNCSGQVESDDQTQTLSWLFTQGVDPGCTGPCSATNCCTVAIHEGMDCSSDASIGGPYWNKQLVSTNPWQDAKYVIQGSLPTAANDVSVTSGFGAAQINGRAAVVYDSAGVRVGCATITVAKKQKKELINGAIDKLNMAVDQLMDHIKDAIEDLAEAANKSHHYGASTVPEPYSCDKANICEDLCKGQNVLPTCVRDCKKRNNALLDIVGIFCEKDACSTPSLVQTGESREEVGLLQSRAPRLLTETSVDEMTPGCLPVVKYCPQAQTGMLFRTSECSIQLKCTPWPPIPV